MLAGVPSRMPSAASSSAAEADRAGRDTTSTPGTMAMPARAASSSACRAGDGVWWTTSSTGMCLVFRIVDDVFEQQRPRLFSLAYRMLGSAVDADDVLQEAWLRWSKAADVRDPAAFLTTVVTRICL